MFSGKTGTFRSTRKTRSPWIRWTSGRTGTGRDRRKRCMNLFETSCRIWKKCLKKSQVHYYIMFNTFGYKLKWHFFIFWILLHRGDPGSLENPDLPDIRVPPERGENEEWTGTMEFPERPWVINLFLPFQFTMYVDYCPFYADDPLFCLWAINIM